MENICILLFLKYLILDLVAESELKVKGIPIGVLFDYPTQDRPKTVHTDWFNVAQFSSVLAWNLESYHNTNNDTINATDVNVDMFNSYEIVKNFCDLMQEGNYALFGSHYRYTYPTIKSFAKVYQMPFVTVGNAVSGHKQEDDYIIFMQPMYTKALVDVMNYYKWKKVIYMFNSEEGLFRMQQLFEEIARDGYNIEIDMYEVTDVDLAYDYLRNLSIDVDNLKSFPIEVMLDMSYQDTEKFLYGQISSMWRTMFSWLLVKLDFFDVPVIEELGRSGMNVTGFRLKVRDESTIMKETLNGWQEDLGRTSITHEEALVIDGITLLSNVFNKLFISQQPESYSRNCSIDTDPIEPTLFGKAILSQLKKEQFSGLTGYITFNDYGLRSNYNLQVWNSDRNGDDRNNWLKYIGRWNDGQGFSIMPQTRPPIDYQPPNPTDKTFIITSILAEPFLMEKIEGSHRLNGNDQFEGYCADLAKLIANNIGFSYRIVPVKDNSYGTKHKSGEWTGMIGEILRKEADLSIAPLTITHSREQVVDFSKPFMEADISILLNKALFKAHHPSPYSFLSPFPAEIWLFMIGAYIMIFVVMLLVTRFNPYEQKIIFEANIQKTVNTFSMKNLMWFVTGSALNKHCHTQPKSIAGRIVGGTSWFFTIVFICLYTSQVFRYRYWATRRNTEDTPIKNLYDLSAQTEIKYGTVSGTSTTEMFKFSRIHPFNEMWSFMTGAAENLFVESYTEGSQRVHQSKGRFALIGSSKFIEFATQQPPCDTRKVDVGIQKDYGIAFPIGSVIRNEINLILHTLREKGTLAQLERKWWYDKGHCPSSHENNDQDSDTSVITARNLSGLFYVVIAGAVLAIATALCEFLIKSYGDSRKRKISFTQALTCNARLALTGNYSWRNKEMSMDDVKTGDDQAEILQEG